MAKSRKPIKAKKGTAKRAATRRVATKRAPAKAVRKTAPARLWLGTGLCPEAQGDGLPCQGVEGECERCGRALPRTSTSA